MKKIYIIYIIHNYIYSVYKYEKPSRYTSLDEFLHHFKNEN